MSVWQSLLEKALTSFFRQGHLTVTWPDGHQAIFGDGQDPKVAVTFKTTKLAKAMLLNPEMALGEGYMSGDFAIEGDDLEGFLKLALINRKRGGGAYFQLIRWAQHRIRSLMLRNPIGRAQENVAHHYDLSAKLYDLFLDADRQYSCAYFAKPDLTLEQAQLEKKRHIARKLALRPGMTVLDIGCGWGGMAITLAQEFGVKVTGVTLSVEQHAYAQRRVQALGLGERIDIRLQDYREVSETFDRVVSVGMFEHVGPGHYHEYFAHLDRLLGPHGVALIHTIALTGPPQVTSFWITKYIFPGGHIPAMREISPHFEDTDLNLTDVEVWRLHYAETLKHWHDRFMQHADKAEALYDAEFVRMWRYYLKVCEQTFRHGRQGVFQLQFARRLDTLPTARDYMYPPALKKNAKPPRELEDA